MEMETITTAIGTAITSLSTNIQTMIGTNLPALLCLLYTSDAADE